METVAKLRNGNGAAHSQAGTGFRNGASNGAGNSNGAAVNVIPATPTTYWRKANDHDDKLDRTRVSALARQVIDGKLSWQEAQSRLDNWIDAATLPTFSTGNGKAAGEKVLVAVSQQAMAERASDAVRHA